MLYRSVPVFDTFPAAGTNTNFGAVADPVPPPLVFPPLPPVPDPVVPPLPVVVPEPVVVPDPVVVPELLPVVPVPVGEEPGAVPPVPPVVFCEDEPPPPQPRAIRVDRTASNKAKSNDTDRPVFIDPLREQQCGIAALIEACCHSRFAYTSAHCYLILKGRNEQLVRAELFRVSNLSVLQRQQSHHLPFQSCCSQGRRIPTLSYR